MTTRARKTTAVRRRRGRPVGQRARPIASTAVTGYGRYRSKVPRSMPRPAPTYPSKSSLSPNWGSALGAVAGNLISPGVGGLVGSLLGHGAQALMKHITGFGDYNVSVNSLMGPAFSPPELINKSREGVCLRHREYIGDVNASSAFSIQSYPIQPGLGTSFPWLAQVASNFEEYMLTGLIYEYKTLSADYTTAASAALGYVVMATQYNVLAPNFQDKKVMENYEFANSAKPSETFIHPVECKRSLNPVSELFVRTGGVPAGADQRLYDLGNFQIATGGNSGTGVIGELWATFEICLYKPKLVGTVGTELLTDHYIATSGLSTSAWFGTNRSLASGSAGFTTIALNRQILFPPNTTDGSYLIVYQVSGASTAAVAGPVLTFTNCAQLTVWQNSTNVRVDNNSTTAPIYIECFVVQITGPNAVVNFPNTSGNMPTSPTAMDLWITQVNGNILT